MKKFFLLSFALCGAFAAQAQSCVSVQQVSTNYANKQITFDLKWGTCNNTNHLYRVWVFVDYRPVTTVIKGAWQRATISATDKGTLVSANKGVWVTGSANATQRVTLTLNVMGNKFDWCAFATDYPPNATLSNGSYTLKGTPPFTVNGVELGDAQKTHPAGTYCITSITDATGNPEGFVNNFNCTCPTIQPGTVGFTSTQTWVIGAQTWSAPVTATYCNKTTFNGGSSGAYNSDCRRYGPAATYGHMFSWCMVVKYASSLCPNGWRVPTPAEFVTLDKALGGTGNNRTGDVTTLAKYMNASTWGGQYGGAIYAGGSPIYLREHAGYWSQSEGGGATCKGGDATCGAALIYNESAALSPQSVGYLKAWGYTLRCVK